MGAKVDVEALHAGEQQLHLCALLRWTQIRRAGAIGLFHLFNQGVPRHFSRPQRPVKVRAGAVLEVRSIDNQPLLVADVQKGPVERSGGSLRLKWSGYRGTANNAAYVAYAAQSSCGMMRVDGLGGMARLLLACLRAGESSLA